jgi:hypothetical protein
MYSIVKKNDPQSIPAVPIFGLKIMDLAIGSKNK